MAKMTDWSREGKAGGWVWEWGGEMSEWKGKGVERGGKIWGKWE